MIDEYFKKIRESFNSQYDIDYCDERFAIRSECFPDAEALELAISDTRERVINKIGFMGLKMHNDKKDKNNDKKCVEKITKEIENELKKRGKTTENIVSIKLLKDRAGKALAKVLLTENESFLTSNF